MHHPKVPHFFWRRPLLIALKTVIYNVHSMNWGTQLDLRVARAGEYLLFATFLNYCCQKDLFDFWSYNVSFRMNKETQKGGRDWDGGGPNIARKIYSFFVKSLTKCPKMVGGVKNRPPPLLYACAYELTMPYTLNIAGTRTGCRFQQRTFQQVLLACPVLNMNQ